MVCGRFIEVAGFHKVSVPNQGRNGFRVTERSLWPFFCGSIAQILSEVCYPEGIDLLKDRQALQRLTEAAEKAKMELSGVQEAGTTHDSHIATCTLEQ